MKLLALLAIFFSTTSQGQIISRLLSGQEAAEARRDAVLALEIYRNNIIAGDGTALFLGSEGYIVTSHHLIEPSTRNPRIETRLFDRQNNRIDYEIISCGDSRDIDLCLLKTDSRPRAFFPTQVTAIGEGHEVWWIGHTNFRNYNTTKSEIIRFYNDVTKEVKFTPEIIPKLKNRGVKSVSHKTGQCRGCSGGPLLDARGNLVGMLDRIVTNSGDKRPDINLAISAEEIIKYYNDHKKK